MFISKEKTRTGTVLVFLEINLSYRRIYKDSGLKNDAAISRVKS
jgi:hypothetical protein